MIVSVSIHKMLRFLPVPAQGAAIVVCSLPAKNEGRLARDVFDTVATRSRLVRGVTDTAC